MANGCNCGQRHDEAEARLMDYSKPACFPTVKLYSEWKDCARIAQEACTICDDCTPKYKYEMREVNKCRNGVWGLYKFGTKER
jgi:hypothetical protein